ncbi:MAG: divalent metal cation transporter FieF [Proteobacteria bacterium]|nr:MAG: divalent metal cation transporter FieF [Pseudomonadota bacterium]
MAPPAPPAAHGPELRRVTRAAVAVALTLVAVKTAAWLATGSVAIASSAVDSLMDSFASGLNLWAVNLSLKPADREHRFGHGKAEALAGLVQAAFVLGSAGFVALEAIARLIDPVELRSGALGVVVMVLSTLATAALLGYQRRVAKRTGSLAIKADSLHYAGDLLMNLAVIAGIVLASELGWAWADSAFAVVVAAVIVVGAVHIARGAIDQLMDRELPDEVRARILALALSEPVVRDAHDLKTRASGRGIFIQLHLSMADGLPLGQAHRAGVRVSELIRAELPNAEVLIHHDPVDDHHPGGRPPS